MQPFAVSMLLPPPSPTMASGWRISANARQALSDLCAAYYAPVVAFLRSEGRTDDDARELAHEFFAKVLGRQSFGGADPQRGRFRTYLLGALNYFLADERNRGQCQKRGGGQEVISVDAIDAEERYRLEPVEQMDAAKLFLRRWAMTLVDQALRRLEAEAVRNQAVTGNGLKIGRDRPADAFEVGP